MPLLTVATCFFAYSTILSWSYYGEKAVEYLFGLARVKVYRLIYVFAVALGPILSLSNALDFSDLMLLSMAFPNILGMVLLSGKVRELKNKYYHKYKATV